MSATDVVVGLAVLVGLIGIVVPVLPGSVLILLAVLGWALTSATTSGWLVLAAVATLLLVGTVVKYAVPGRRLRDAGVPGRTLLAGGLLGVVGFFVVPVVGLLLGFVLGVYLAELHRVGRERARATTGHALRAAGLSVLIELVAGMLAAVTWLVAALGA